MSLILKKARENLQFEIFLDICDAAPRGIACAQEVPDFLVRSADRFVGVELTQYFKPALPGRRPIQEMHSLQAMIVERAQRIYESWTGDLLRVNVVFRPHAEVGKREAIQLATALAVFLQDCRISELQERFDPWDEGGDIRSITAVYAYRCTGRVRSLWRIATAGAVRPLDPADVQAIIATKEPDIGRYDQRAAENVLVIVLDGSAASFASLTDSARQFDYSTSFGQVHFLDVANGTCTDLRIAGR